MQTNWRETRLPDFGKDHWAVLRRGKVEIADESEVATLMRSWQPQNPVLLGAPGAEKFQIPITVGAYSDVVRHALQRRNRALSMGFLTLAAFMLVLAVVLLDVRPLLVGFGSMLFGMAFWLEARRFYASIACIERRARFFYWLYTSAYPRRGLILWVAIVSLTGIVQGFSLFATENLATVFESYGAMYPALDEGQYWRLITGPFLHYSLLHYGVNAILLVVTGTLAWIAVGRVSIILFVLGCIVSTYCQYEFGGRLFDSTAGLSGGLFTLIGFLALYAVFDNRAFPEGLIATIVMITLAGGIYSAGVSEATANITHLSGLATGMVLALLSSAVPGGKKQDSRGFVR